MSTHRTPAQSGHCPKLPSPQPFSSLSPQEPPINWHFKAKNNLPPGSLSIHGNRLQPFPAMSDTHALTPRSECTPLLPQGGLGPTLVPRMPRPDTSKTAYWVWGGIKETQPIPSHQRCLGISGAHQREQHLRDGKASVLSGALLCSPSFQHKLPEMARK